MKLKFLGKLFAGFLALTLVFNSISMSAYADGAAGQPDTSIAESGNDQEQSGEKTTEASGETPATSGAESGAGDETVPSNVPSEKGEESTEPATPSEEGGESAEPTTPSEEGGESTEPTTPPEEGGESAEPAAPSEEGDITEEPVEEELPELDGIAFFSINGFQSETHDVFKHTESVIAPGVEQYINYAYAKDGKQMVYYVATADISRDDVLVQSAYKDAQCTSFGMDKLTNQMAAANAKYSDKNNEEFISEYYTAVVGTNGDFYNMTTGQPSGAFVMNGVMSSNKANNRPWFAIFEDGTALCGANNADWDAAIAAHGAAQQAVGGSQVLIKDGKDITASASGSYNTDRHSRTMVGVTAEGKVVMAVLDGRQEPFSCGGTMHELAQIMLEAGCVSAINLDGGGSTTFVSRPEGADSIQVINRPSDGSERSISSGLIIASTAAPSDAFDHAALTVEEEYVTPGSAVKVSAVGVSPAGTAAGIPEDVIYVATNGIVDENDMFISDGTVGDAVIQMFYNGEVVGEATVHVVIPETFVFTQPTITLPYGKTTTVSFTATYGLNTVAVKASDVIMTAEEEASVVFDGFNVTACDETAGVTGTKITATLSCAGLTAEAALVFGKGSEVVQDFENFEIPNTWTIKTGYPQYGPAGANGQNEKGSIEIVTAENGKVHSGNSAFAINVDMTQLYETGYHLLNLSFGADSFRFPAEATAFGFWMYVPEDTEGLYSRWNIDTAGDGKADYTPEHLPVGLASTYAEPGWHYYSIDLSKYNTDVNAYTIQIYTSDRDGASYNYYFKDHYSVDSKYTLYIDDITVDYSSVVEDREAPVFTSVRYADQAMSDAAELNGQTVADSRISFSAMVREDMTKDNYTGINASSAKAYIDGVAVSSTYADGVFVIQDAVLADGVHTVAFEIADMMGNTARVSRKITVAADESLTYVNFVPQTPDADKILIGSVQWYDLTTNAAEKIDSITTVLNLNSVSNWELEGMTVAKGFEASYTIDEVTNDATVTITRTGNVDTTGEMVIASIPVRTWVSTITKDPGYESSTPVSMWTRKIIWPKDIRISVDYGLIRFTDGTTGSFSSDKYQTITELYGNYAALNANGDYTNKKSWHIHTAVSLADQDATCIEAGYRNRTYCEVCHSVVEWGTTTPATGHSYELVGGVLKCTACDVRYTGTWTDGKEYVDGALAAEGWNGNRYYADGVKLTGVQKVTAPDNSGEFYYDFGEDGVSTGKYTGSFFDGVAGVYRYSQLGILSSGWKTIDGDWYLFSSKTMSAATGNYTTGGITYHFEENGKLTSGVWVKGEKGSMYYYGPAQYSNGWQTIDEKTYYFKNRYCLTGYQFIVESNSTIAQWYDFGEDGAMVGKLTMTGLLETEEGLYYLEDGISKTGLVCVDGDYYYFRASTKAAVVSETYTITNTNGMDFKKGAYEFDSTGKMVIKNGLVKEDGGLYYYVNGTKDYAGLIEINGDYYYIRSNCQAVTGTSYYVQKTNGLKPVGNYEFDADGRMILKNGLVKENGGIYYYENGARTYAGLIEIEGYFYYIRSNCQAVTGTSYYVQKTNGLKPVANYEFDAEGRMVIKNGLVRENGGIYYYENGAKTYAGLIEIDGDYYYIRSNCQAVTGTSYYVQNTNGLKPVGNYEFDAEGRMVIKNGLVKENGGIYYYENGAKTYAGLIEIDGDYYYIRSNCQAVTGTSYYVQKTNGLKPVGNYEFDVEGRMVIKNGLVKENGGIYYYESGAKKYAGLIEIDGDYYYIRSNCQAVTGTSYYVQKTNGLKPVANYQFDEEGKMK